MSEFRTLRAHQYLYYVLAHPIISDQKFDEMEAEYEERTGQELPIGSESERHYTRDEIDLAKSLLKGVQEDGLC